MSTTIYDGMILDYNSKNNIFSILDAITIKVKSIAVLEAAKSIAECFTMHYDLKSNMSKIIDEIWKRVDIENDEYIINNAKSNISNIPLIKLMVNIINKKNIKNRTSYVRDTEFNFSLTIYLYSYNNDILIIPYTEIAAYQKILLSYFRYFDYYDNTDKPDNITDEEWDKRDKMWEVALEKVKLKYEAYDRFESVLEITNELYLNILDFIPPKEERALYLAKLEIFNSLIKEKNVGAEYVEMNNAVSLYTSARNRLESPDMINKVNELKEKYITELDDITIDVLKNYVAPKG